MVNTSTGLKFKNSGGENECATKVAIPLIIARQNPRISVYSTG